MTTFILDWRRSKMNNIHLTKEQVNYIIEYLTEEEERVPVGDVFDLITDRAEWIEEAVEAWNGGAR